MNVYHIFIILRYALCFISYLLILHNSYIDLSITNINSKIANKVIYKCSFKLKFNYDYIPLFLYIIILILLNNL